DLGQQVAEVLALRGHQRLASATVARQPATSSRSSRRSHASMRSSSALVIESTTVVTVSHEAKKAKTMAAILLSIGISFRWGGLGRRRLGGDLGRGLSLTSEAASPGPAEHGGDLLDEGRISPERRGVDRLRRRQDAPSALATWKSRPCLARS